MDTAPSPPADSRLRRKREILEAASRVFRRRGIHAAGMRDIAAEAGMTVGNLYYYFDSKQDLLAFCQEDGLAGLLELAARLRRSGLDADATLYLLVVGHVLRVNEETPGALAHLEVEGLGGRFRDAILRRRREYEEAVEAFIDDGIAGGVFRPVDSKVAAFAILGALNWTVKWYRPGGGKSALEIGREFAELLVGGLLAPGREPAEPDLALLTTEPPGEVHES